MADNRKRIRELADEMVAIADSAERYDCRQMRIKARKDAIRFLLTSERRTSGKGDPGLAELAEEASDVVDTVEVRRAAGNDLVRAPRRRRGFSIS